jgi:hypothetical protein
MSFDTQKTVASVFESFNARSLAPEQVARSFIPPAQFADLASRCHCTVVGPRGSGKTSVLKMLQPSALEAWASDEAQTYRARIDYTGIFIPTDISWSKQVLAVVEGLPAGVAKAFRGAAFTTHVLHELIAVMEWRTQSSGARAPFRRVFLSLPQARPLVRELAKSWLLEPTTETLLGLKHSLAHRLVQLWSLAQRITLLGAPASDLPPWLTLEFLSCVQQAIELFDDATGEREARWALLFDELELAPDWIMQGLLTALRSTEPKVLFKLSVSPFNERHEAIRCAVQAMPDQDYKEIRLWHAQKEEGFQFSERLFLSVCRDYGFAAKELSQILGRSFLEDEGGSPRAYVKRGRNYRVLARALIQDPSFARFWRQSGVDLDTVAKLTEEERAAKVRKIYPLVMVRTFFRVPAGSKQASQQIRRGRKSMELYSGADAFLTIAEANPRWIIGLTRLLLSGVRQGKVSRVKQAQEIESTIHKFRATLKTITLGHSTPKVRTRTLLELVDRVGNYFQRRVLLDEFHPQPPLTFTVDSHAPPDLVSAVGRAVNVGALVFVPDKSSVGILNDVKGKRFRLSYLLAPYYRLPLSLGSAISLGHILWPKPEDDPTQGELLPKEAQ